jgi:hypothetical protein
MFLVVNAYGNYWNGFGWSEQGKEFFSPAAAQRSLHEGGEDLELAHILEVNENDPT